MEKKIPPTFRLAQNTFRIAGTKYELSIIPIFCQFKEYQILFDFLYRSVYLPYPFGNVFHQSCRNVFSGIPVDYGRLRPSIPHQY